MNDPMPPESLPPESTSFTASIPPVVPTDENEPPVPPVNRRKYDELIAVVVALLGIGSILFWVLGKNNPIAGKLPFGGLASGQLSGGATGSDRQLPDFTKLPTADKGLFQTGGIADKSGADTNLSLVSKAGQAENTRNLTRGIAVGDAAAGIAAAGAGQADAQPTTQPGGDTAGNNNVAVTTPSAASSATAPAVAPTATATATPEIVEEDKLPEATEARKFSDVPKDSALAPYVDALSSRGVLDLFDDGTLNPDTPITRGEFANLVSKAFGKPRIKDAIAFTDTPNDEDSKAAITEATRTGFMTGFPDKSFKPDLNIPRYQMQVAIVTGTQFAPGGDPVQALSNFTDRDSIPKWAVPKVATAVGAGVLPTPDKTVSQLVPNQAATRGEAVVMLHEALVKEGKLEAVK